jgi:Ca2+-binding RTX toxin-like protein
MSIEDEQIEARETGGASADYLDGGADFDLVRYDFATAAVTVNLANPAPNTGEAAGDVLLNFEGIIGSNFADMLIGDGAANTIHGGLGGDAIAGGAGGDTLNGGDGADVLFGQADADLIAGGAGGDIIRGGLGGDLIVFNVGDNGDLIQNFNEGGVRDGFDLRGFFDATGFTGADPRAAGILQVLQSGADADVYLYGAFAFRIEGSWQLRSTTVTSCSSNTSWPTRQRRDHKDRGADDRAGAQAFKVGSSFRKGGPFLSR